jgi:hypothetical protein
MAIPDKNRPDTAVRVERGDTLSAIAKANNLTLKEIRDLNPQLMSNPKYNSGSTIFSNTLINIAKPTPKAEPDVRGDNPPGSEGQPDEPKKDEPKKDETPADQPPAGDSPVIPGTSSTSGNISEFGTGAPTYTAPTQTAEEIATQTETTAAATARLDAFNTLSERYKQYGLGGLADVIKKLVIEGASEATITFALQESPEYKERFKANTARLAKGLAVLKPNEYIAVEDSYRQALRAYGLTQFDNDAYVSKFIENDMSPSELNARIQLATERVTNAAPQVRNTLVNFYGLTDVDLIAYTLDPKGQLPQIEKQIATAEIGAAAARQGFQDQVGKANAEYLRSIGVTQEQAVRGFADIANVLPTATKLTDIYKDGLEGYGLEQAQQEVFGNLASERRKREKLAAAETATFGGKSAMGATALDRPSSKGQI